MEGNIFEALKLLGVGMVTVFCVLVLIINASKGLIAFVNSVIGADEASAKPAAAQSGQAIDPAVAQAIAQAVDAATGGKGAVQSITRA